ncbi:MAG: Branched-chain amino acid transport system 2 carrier protein [Candidatus Anoxychlamydiales bacterium]|nr:Branched-chain amino acid transport system 2 carrier protein [Candidatus Anoxychlamydiales bacterium]
MKNKLSIFSLGLAIFTMLFGAGNIVFPLILGREVGSQITPSMIGFLITAVVVPIIGLSSAILFEGDYKKFLGNIGQLPSIIIIFIIMVFLIGPLGATTRCFILSYSAMKYYIPFIPIWAYTLFAAILIFFLTYKENKVVDILGTVLGPIKFTLLLAIIIVGMATLMKFQKSAVTSIEGFNLGVKTGYFTLDMLGTIFFARLIYDSIKTKFDKLVHPKKIIYHCLKAGVICAFLLGFIYFSFGIISASWASKLQGVPKEQLLSILSIKILGQGTGLLANIAVAVATLVTATALTTLFADYLTFTLLKGKISYHQAVILTLTICIVMVNLQFDGIMKIISPIAVTIYPSLIVLSILNIFNKTLNLKEKYIKPTVWATFIVTIMFLYIVPAFV